MYPSWRYHRTLPACVVEHPEADDALGSDWTDTPAAFLEEDAALEDDSPESEPDQAAEPCLSAKKTRKSRKRTTS